jgi:signal recognition particle receptor subunit alpha
MVSIGVPSKLTAARENGFDVVLIDTAGRMQDNEPLMRALAKVR